ncbi:MAG TPA: hypothetical protein VNW46_11390, partial [Gemmatimonadaceae bacterium]|nr:hypothetical protein [Gemmatimonadaceae bacterium]
MLARFRPFAPAVLVLATVNCFTYPAQSDQRVQPGHDVRLTLNDAGTTELAPRLGPQVGEVTGRLRGVDSAGYEVALTRTTTLRGQDNGWNGEVVTIPRSDVAETRQRTFSVVRSVILCAGIVGVAVAVGLIAGGGNSGGGQAP